MLLLLKIDNILFIEIYMKVYKKNIRNLKSKKNL